MEKKLNNFQNLLLKNINTSKISKSIDTEIETLKKLLNDEEKRLKLIIISNNDNHKNNNKEEEEEVILSSVLPSTSTSSFQYAYNKLPKQTLAIGPITSINNNNNNKAQSNHTSCSTPLLTNNNDDNINNKIIKLQLPLKVNIDQNNNINKDYTADILNNYRNSVFNNNNNNKLNEGITEASYVGNIKIHEINKNGYYIRLINVSNNIDENISNYLIEQMVSNKPINIYRFPNNLILKAGHTVTIWSNTDEIQEQVPHTFINREQDKWGTGPECITILSKPNGQAVSWTTGCHKYGNVGN